MSSNYKFMQNARCEYFPCHSGIKDNFNCMFCFCPLYERKACGGNYTYTDSGIKDCSACLIPHKEGGYDYIIERLKKAK